jgi:hypothetical protein
MVEPRETVEPETEDAAKDDLLTVGLLVYFVALIALVAGLLVLPLIL